MTVAAIGLGALFGAGVSAAMGGDPLKGALYGAVGGGVGGGVAAASPTNITALGGGAIGGAAGGAGSSIVGGLKAPVLKTPATPTPGPTTVQAPYAGQAERERRKRRRGYGSTLVAGGELGTATTTRKQILG